MLISYDEINIILASRNIDITGALHVGAHECEELPFYIKLGLKPQDIIWIDAIPSKVLEMRNKGIPNIYNNVISAKDDETTIFNVSNNIQSSSILELGTHLHEYPNIFYTNKITQKSITIDSFFKRNSINPSKFNFWNFDIQGAELLALHGAQDSLKYVQALYLEVNEKELYKNCGLINDIDVFLSKYNFKRVITSMTTCGWGDALYVIDSNN